MALLKRLSGVLVCVILAGCSLIGGAPVSSEISAPAGSSPEPASGTQSPTPSEPSPTTPTPHPEASAEAANIGEMPSGFAMPNDVAEAQGMGVLALCGERADYAALSDRVASRFWYFSSESGESGSEGAALTMTSTSAAAELMAQIRARYFECRGQTPLRNNRALAIEPLVTEGDWDQAIGFVSEIVSTKPKKDLLVKDGTATLIAQSGPAIAVSTYWIYFAQPVTGKDADELAQDLPGEVEDLLQQLR